MMGTAGTASRYAAQSDRDLDAEIEIVCAALDEHGRCERPELIRIVGGRGWGPGRFRRALREAVDEGRVRHVAGDGYEAAGSGQPPTR
jgi:hypothetical protein